MTVDILTYKRNDLFVDTSLNYENQVLVERNRLIERNGLIEQNEQNERPIIITRKINFKQFLSPFINFNSNSILIKAKIIGLIFASTIPCSILDIYFQSSQNAAAKMYLQVSLFERHSLSFIFYYYVMTSKLDDVIIFPSGFSNSKIQLLCKLENIYAIIGLLFISYHSLVYNFVDASNMYILSIIIVKMWMFYLSK